MRAAQPLPAQGTRGLAPQPGSQPQPSNDKPAVDPVQLLRGIFGR
jgi:hypothetical protein